MIRAEFRTDGGVYELRVAGHAGYRPGNDIVCAGCSAIVYALVGALRDGGRRVKDAAPHNKDAAPHNKDAAPQGEVAYALKSGDAYVRAEGDVGALFRMAEVGLMQIERAHPEHVRVRHSRAQ